MALTALVHLNLTVPMLLVQALLPAFVRQPHAAMVAVGSTFGSIGFAGFAGYSASKFGLRGLFEALAREHAGTSVRFQYLSPRATATAFNLRRWMRSMRRWEQRWIVPRTSPQRSCNRSCAAMHGVSWGGRKNCLPGSTGCCPNWWTAPCANSFTSSTAMRGLAALPPHRSFRMNRSCRKPRIFSALGLCMIAGAGWAAGLPPQVAQLQDRWAVITYQLPKPQRVVALEALAQQSDQVRHALPDDADALIWDGIVRSSLA